MRASLKRRRRVAASPPASGPWSERPAGKAGDALREWNAQTVSARILRRNPEDVEPERLVVAVVGVTGSGKSTLANVLCAGVGKPFKRSDSVVSVTSSVAYRDYSFVGLKWRVIDTPGLCDTNTSEEETERELQRLALFAREGVAAFVICVPRGRFTPEQERAVEEVMEFFGPDMLNHAVVAVTRCTEKRDALLDDISRLPMEHVLRRLTTAVDYRVVPCENTRDPERAVSRMVNHQRILDMLDENGGSRFDVSAWVRAREEAAKAATGGDAAIAQHMKGVMSSGAGRCEFRQEKRHGRVHLVLDCELREAPSQ